MGSSDTLDEKDIQRNVSKKKLKKPNGNEAL